jgi:glyoxylase-like metal-dependent hydrolase (beta-lactamase superfamily II)
MTATVSPMVTTDPAQAKLQTFAAPQEVAPGVLMHAAFVNTYAMRTPAGLLLVDPGLAVTSQGVHSAVRAWSDAPLHTAVYTHGHADHAFGLRAFLDAGERPHIIAQENCPKRFQRYRLTHGLNAHINQRQFSTPRPIFPDQFDWPTLTFRDSLTQKLGDLKVRYYAAKGETDDHCYVWIPERSYLFTGDLIVWVSPNCGNPQKVQRYPVEWAEALERMASLDAEWLFPRHGLVVHGKAAVRMVLTDTARYLRVIIDQVLTRLNAGQTPEEICTRLNRTRNSQLVPTSSPVMTIPNSSCVTCCDCGAAGGTGMQLTCCLPPGRRKPKRSRLSPVELPRWSSAAGCCLLKGR